MIVREFRQAWRRLAKRPGYTALTVVVLGAGLGVVVFLFGAINSFVLQPLPFPHAERLVAIGAPNSHSIGRMDSDQYLQLKGKLRSLDVMGALTDVGVNLDSGSGATFYSGARMTASIMTLLGVKPILGRNLAAGDDAPGAPRVVVLSETIWRHAFGADPHMVGRSVQVNGQWATVVGVLPANFAFPNATRIWLPLRIEPGQHRGIVVEGRLAPSTQMSQARAELDAWAARLQRALPVGAQTTPLVIGPLSASIVPADLIRWVWLMFGAGVLVLLLACINVANLQLVQTLQRRHELALRSALGSSRARLVFGALAESLLLAVAALAVAFPIAHACTRWVTVMWFDTHPSMRLVMHGIDAWVIAFGVVIAVLSTLLAGGIPAWRASRADLQDALRDGSKGAAGGGFARVAKTMVVAEVALTVVLLVGAGMFVRAIDHLLAQPDVGSTHAEHVLIANVMLPSALYPDDAQRIRFFHDVIERLRRDPDVVDATASNTVPSARLGSHEDISLPGHAQPTDGWSRVQMGIVDAHFMDTYGVRLLKGRFFDARERVDGTPVTVIDAKTAAAFWPHQDPLNRTLVLYPGKQYAQKLTVIGVIQALQLDNALDRSLPSLLIPLSQAAGTTPLHSVGLAVRTHAKAGTFTQDLANAVHAVDPQAAVYSSRSQARAMAQSRVGLTLLTDVFAALGLVALLLAAAGLYGVLAFSVAQRTREIGIRRAIGAGSAAVAGTVGRTLVWQLGIGLVLGLALAVPWSSVLADPGLGTRAHNPAIFIPVVLLVIGVSVLAALVPLIRALRVDPVVALRHE